MSVDDGLRVLFRKNIPRCHWQSVETGFTSRGVPDSNFCLDGFEGWVEFKSVRRGWIVPLRPEQIAWLITREKHGGRTFVAVRRRTEGADELWIFRGKYARELRDYGLRHPQELLTTAGGPSRWDWEKVRYALQQYD